MVKCFFQIRTLDKICSRVLVISALSLLAHVQLAAAEALSFSYWNEASAPFIVSQKGEAPQGLLVDLGNEISRGLGKEAKFIQLPVARIESWLVDGMVDIDCVTNPVWKKNAESLYWSPALFRGADRVLVKKGQGSRYKTLEDLHGLTVGIYKSYTYDEVFQQRIDTGQIDGVKMLDLSNGLQLLKLGRIDALVDFGLTLRYHLSKGGLKSDFELADVKIEEFDLHCAYSKKSNTLRADIDQTIEKLIESGQIENLLARYR